MPDNPRIEDLRRRILLDPASIAFAQLAEEYRRAGQPTKAVEVCRRGLAVHPGYLSARVTLGRALLEVGELDDAKGELEQVLKSAPENLAAIRGLAEVHHRRGALSEALTQYRAALSLARNDPDLVQTVEDLSRKLTPPKRPDPDEGLSLEQMQRELAVHAPPVPVTARHESTPPVVAASSAVDDVAAVSPSPVPDVFDLMGPHAGSVVDLFVLTPEHGSDPGVDLLLHAEASAIDVSYDEPSDAGAVLDGNQALEPRKLLSLEYLLNPGQSDPVLTAGSQTPRDLPFPADEALSLSASAPIDEPLPPDIASLSIAEPGSMDEPVLHLASLERALETNESSEPIEFMGSPAVAHARATVAALEQWLAVLHGNRPGFRA